MPPELLADAETVIASVVCTETPHTSPKSCGRVLVDSDDWQAALRLAVRVMAQHPTAESVGCQDCGRPYGHEHGFPDLIITKDAWHRISPTGDDGGLLCPSCICKRLHDVGMRDVEGAFMSGPIKSVDPSLMHTIRWVENLREQGHGWRCPDCGKYREKSE